MDGDDRVIGWVRVLVRGWVLFAQSMYPWDPTGMAPEAREDIVWMGIGFTVAEERLPALSAPLSLLLKAITGEFGFCHLLEPSCYQWM